jgi:hypothetical protein
VQPTHQIGQARRLALNFARSHHLDIKDLFRRWRWLLRSRSESRS